jgi:hypothetical protein
MKFLPWLVLSFIAGCSSPYQFSNEIGSFSTGVDNVRSAYITGYNNLATDRQTLQTLNFNDTSAKIKLANSCYPGGDSTLPCDFYRQGEPQPSRSVLAADRPKTLDDLDVLANYAHALQAVTNAADRAAFDSAAARLNASVTALGKAAGPQGTAASAAFSAGFNIFAWVLGQALDQERFDTLKQDVNLANGPLKWDDHNGWVCPEHSVCPVYSIAKGLGSELDSVSETRRKVVTDTVNAQITPLRPGYKNYMAREATATQTKAVLIQLIQTKPSQVTDALIKAHNALRDAVNDPKGSFGNFATAVGKFAELAEALKSSLATPAKAPSSSPGS